jgi:GDPmannose 4,6-dehydratase
MKKIIITGVTGQDGSLMVDYLLNFFSSELGKSDYMIYGAIRRLSVKNHENITHLEGHPNFKLINMDLNDPHSMRDVIIKINPDYFINFAAQSFVAGSWDYPIQTWDTDADAVLHILESIRRFAPDCRFYNAGSSEEFGDVISSPQNESHPLRPQSPYGAAKCGARHIVRVYRESYNLYAIQGWLFNHEGTRRGLDFVTRKISHGVASIKTALDKERDIPILELGNIDARRDWSDAEDFMEGVWLMLNQLNPKNYVLGSGEMHSVREFLEESFRCAGIEFYSEGSGDKEKYYTKDKRLIFRVNPKYYRPAEVHKLCGDSSLAEKEIGWTRKTNFKGLVKKMYDHDYSLLNE